MAERTKADGNGDGEASVAAPLDNAAGGSAATPISAARRSKANGESTDAAGKDAEETSSKDESGTSGGEQEEAKPVRTAADIVAENKARRAAEDAAAAKAETESPAAKASAGSSAAVAKGSTATETRPVVRKTTENATTTKVAETRGRAVLTAAGNGLNRARNLIASIVWLVAVLCAAVLALGALFTALSQTNESNEIVKWVLARGEDLVGPFGDLFKLETTKSTLLVNWGIAALAYLVVGKIAERIIRP